MDVSTYVGLSGQEALTRRLETIANNIANAGTVGYRSEGVSFSTIMSRTEPFSTSFAFEGGSHINTSSGGFAKTGNPLDFAIQGDALIGISTPNGTAYTRDGRMQMLPTGDLVSLNGHPILDASGSPLTADPNGGELTISRDGTVLQNGRSLGAIGLFSVDFNKGYQRYENSGFFPSAPAQPVDDFTRNGVVQGFTEESNVNPIVEMTRLIDVQRAFEAMSTSVEQRDGELRDTIQALGARSS